MAVVFVKDVGCDAQGRPNLINVVSGNRYVDWNCGKGNIPGNEFNIPGDWYVSNRVSYDRLHKDTVFIIVPRYKPRKSPKNISLSEEAEHPVGRIALRLSDVNVHGTKSFHGFAKSEPEECKIYAILRFADDEDGCDADVPCKYFSSAGDAMRYHDDHPPPVSGYGRRKSHVPEHIRTLEQG